ncbi:D-alanyl-D-alanine carboxypeptidase family protein [Clostridium lacusfryxellense]|uniref:D-alanyl-D-alanine carboxypeptidase family protein n=1 Tax=Clostridium lacusfryxellense TaxID=205328 RepID=UPI001C0D7510|nr:D-alanyl-D-alanine carboxypeptidase family protein [Clostridium lacusfryxellense]MBU3110437.1 D-alanyl-D-alanine carboxypeptidase [Clostridium lacusfryxellense]
MKRLITIIITSFFLLFNTFPAVKALSSPPEVSADSVVLMDATTGKLLYQKNKDSAYPPASTTKIMTVLLVLENTKLDDIVTVSKNAEMTDGSKIYLIAGEKISIKELLYGLILASANDCAVALAEHISGSTENFAELMNKKANSLGCKNTNFVNPNGLYDVNHKTSAYGLSLIMQELIKHPEYKVIATTPSYLMAVTNKSKAKRPLWNENRLIQKADQYYYPGSEGGKTGYTIQSKHSYIATANRNGHKLIVALVHDPVKTFFPDSIKLLNYGFDNFELSEQFKKDDVVSNLTLDDGTALPLLATKDLYVVKEKKANLTPTIKTEQTKPNLSSIKKGDLVSKAIITLGKDSYNLELSSGIDYSKKIVPLTNTFTKNSKISPSIVNILKYLVPILIILLFIRRGIKKKRRRKKRLNRFVNNLNNRKQ